MHTVGEFRAVAIVAVALLWPLGCSAESAQTRAPAAGSVTTAAPATGRPGASAPRIWVVDAFSGKPILPDTPVPRDANASLSIQAAQGETTSASFVVRGSAPQPNVSFSVTPLRAAGASLAPATVDLRYVKVWYQADGAWDYPRIRTTRKPVLVPELLLKNPDLVQVDPTRKTNRVLSGASSRAEYRSVATRKIHKGPQALPPEQWVQADATALQPVALAPNRNQQLWLTVRIPPGQAPGVYRGHIDLRDAAGSVLAQVPLSITVLDFALAEPDLLYGLYYRGQLAPGQPDLSSELKSERQLALELADIVDHGFAYTTNFQGNSNPLTRTSLARQRSATLRDTYQDIYDAAGFSRDAVYLFGFGTAYAAARPQQMRQLLSTYRARGYSHMYVYGRDEAAGDVLKAQYSDWKALRALGLRTIAANNRHDLLETGMSRVLDTAVLARELKPAEARALRAAGVRHVLSYNRPQTAIENPAAYRRHYGFDLIGAGYDGAMVYAYQHGFGSVWDDFDHDRFRDHNFTYPTRDGVIGTLAWEGMRAAINDARYFATLERTLDQHAGDSAQARALRAERTAIVDTLGRAGGWTPASIRARLVELIARAQALEP